MNPDNDHIIISDTDDITQADAIFLNIILDTLPDKELIYLACVSQDDFIREGIKAHIVSNRKRAYSPLTKSALEEIKRNYNNSF